MTIRFNDAFARYLAEIRRSTALFKNSGDVVVVRDVFGRLRLAVSNAPPDRLPELMSALKDAAGAYFLEPVLVGVEMLSPELIFKSQDIRLDGGVAVLERALNGADWARPLLRNDVPSPPRATLYGIKGGVGRSTALTVWARHLAEQGQRVLVIDLDLESPGVSASLAPSDFLPEFGVIDWLVEDAVGCADLELLAQMSTISPLGQSASGEVLVVPCAGASDFGAGYMAKLARAYADVRAYDSSTRSLAERIATMIDALESHLNPTIVLLDSRAGLHDIAGIATTRLGATTFLFAVNSAQTWQGYRILLNNWSQHPDIARDVRERVHVVAAQVPETERDSYLERATESAYELFSESFYEESGPRNPSAFNFDVFANEAPHRPIPVYWSRVFQDWDPLAGLVNVDQQRAAFGEFIDEATDLILSEDSD